MNLTLFLGAGFSAHFNHPTMDSFLGFADASDRVSAEEKQLLAKLVLEARRANSFLESSPTNLEDILSFSEMGERLALTEAAENRAERLRTIVRRVYTTAPPAEEYWPRYKALGKLIGAAPNAFRGNLAFVTTNYDVNIESACYSLGMRMYPGFGIDRPSVERVSVAGQFYQSDGVPLYKLHGSVNWFASSTVTGIAVEDRVVVIQGFRSTESLPLLPLVCANDYVAASAPIIVPPSFLKTELSPSLRAVWSGAAKALSASNIVAFVGYSFPPSDTEMMYFLARALVDNAGLRGIYVVDPRAEEITQRLRHAGSKTGSHFRDLLRPIPQPWADVQLPL